ncbi:peptidoglycan-binding domain-containing protein [Tritonibacter scottomollicae]|uniref:peptidoglycan-binding domain-containing protein n=1 Tax=Tritonibacter scottomollicae TaxID=483013 RepID=UPI003BA8FD0A
MTAPLPPRSGLAFLRHDVLNLFLMRQLHMRASVPDGVVVPRSASSRLRLAALMTVNLAVLSGCLAPPPFEGVGRPAPPGALPGTCWDTLIEPARVETITEQVMVSPPETAADGSMTKPAVFATETRQEITRPRKETYFQTPCPDAMTREYVSSLQRALAARDLYQGEITGTLNAETRAAIRSYQKDIGIDSASLSLRGARSLGLSAVVVDR